ncbi:MAG: hypothetical protein LBE25_09295 [Arthrobacter sp.]|jgi:uncharacterized protein YqiB (DUF1249 family)|nr:hypothetical protein [Arthrobacter sp.]
MQFIKITHDRAPGYSIAVVDEERDVIYRYSSATEMWHQDPTLVEVWLFGDAYGNESVHIEKIDRAEAARALPGVPKLDRRMSAHRHLIEQQERQLAAARTAAGRDEVRTTAEVGIQMGETRKRPTTAPGLAEVIASSRVFRIVARYPGRKLKAANELARTIPGVAGLRRGAPGGLVVKVDRAGTAEVLVKVKAQPVGRGRRAAAPVATRKIVRKNEASQATKAQAR